MNKTRTGLLGALMLAVAAASFTPIVAEAKRLGGGGSAGIQRSTPQRSTPQTPPPNQATPNQAAPNQAAPAQQAAPAAAGTAAAAAAPKRNWLGPVAGLAAGLGIAALLSHFGMGEAVANFVMMALLAIAAIFLIRFLVSRFAGKKAGPQPAYAGAAAGTSTNGSMASPWNAQQGLSQPMQRQAEGFNVAQPGTGFTTAGMDGSAVAPAASGPNLPADFDQASFERAAKMIFIRMQAANDAADLNDLRQFTTPELFAHLRLDLQERGGKAQTTDVVRVDAQVLDWVQERDQQVVSVRYSGLVREERDAPAADFDEVWHLVRPADGSRDWAIAGIQQYSH
ncbi:TIM44-like domain-containing protein [uncultured Azohydromonas sp.]|uniref:Tim44 domain-containing protein n=1 Tax=uncultured Azohydromonas sp. TaxID=487342 RepID=UPI002620BA19|nr:TIM44-like domain-containing protein [uncultured Azohydromonas sp.]